ncbi:MAG: hypothetical protein ABIQ44_01700 [Chloroflexia bacterium]
MLIVTKKVFNTLKPRTKEELLAAVFSTNTAPFEVDEAFDWENRVDLTPGQVEEFMRTLNAETTAALRVIAENGPYIHATELDNTGIADYASFQRSTTRRTRTVTEDGDAYLLAWDDWENGVGKYAVTPRTHRSLRIFFTLD